MRIDPLILIPNTSVGIFFGARALQRPKTVGARCERCAGASNAHENVYDQGAADIARVSTQKACVRHPCALPQACVSTQKSMRTPDTRWMTWTVICMSKYYDASAVEGMMGIVTCSSTNNRVDALMLRASIFIYEGGSSPRARELASSGASRSPHSGGQRGAQWAHTKGHARRARTYDASNGEYLS